ncbi:glycine cleavage system aminomethyltransferase GcvT [Salana multivorans]|uniref:glycine cleavage system aminomethyltransferase GcvT n=1 Tax=Salana multivorans TaxID=120377 RepID=UPI00248F4DCF|nr:glycine cleavage system aminomethyltransferase GcvT [Salana multivorans]
MTVPDLARTPLHDRHVAAGATMVPFAGWSMPVKYTSDVAEHHAVRTAAGLFDISHMGQIVVSGPDAAAFLDHALAGRLGTLAPLQSRYTMMLTPGAGIVDDLIVTNTNLPGEGTLAPDDTAPTPTRFLVVANAANRTAVVRALTEQLVRCEDPADRYDVEVTETGRALLAVQGPAAAAILADLVDDGTLRLDPAAGVGLGDLRYYRTVPGWFAGGDVVISRTGYTGEDGFELAVDPAAAGGLWDALLRAGEPRGLVRAGLAARDTLRLEAGMPLYGHELTTSTYPFQAGLGRVVATSKPDFVGRDAYLLAEAEDDAHPAPVLVGLALEGRRAARAGYPVLDDAGAPVGTVTSGVLSPTLGHPIAMAYVPPSMSEVGTRLAVDVRGSSLPAVVVDLPFYRRAKES